MTLPDFISLQPKSNWIGKLAVTLHTVVAALSADQKKSIIKEIIAEITAGKLKTGREIDLVFLGTFVGKNMFLTKAKQAGILRHTRYVESRNPVFSITSSRVPKNKTTCWPVKRTYWSNDRKF